jgi:integrase
MVTGMRRGEVLALRWSDVDLTAGMLAIRRNYVRSRTRGIEKETKTHQMRRISLDAEAVAMLAEHRARYEEKANTRAVDPSEQAFVFSHQPLHDAPADPSAVTHRYGRMCRALGIDSHLHALRHSTGARRGEQCAVRWSSVNLDDDHTRVVGACRQFMP